MLHPHMAAYYFFMESQELEDKGVISSYLKHSLTKAFQFLCDEAFSHDKFNPIYSDIEVILQTFSETDLLLVNIFGTFEKQDFSHGSSN